MADIGTPDKEITVEQIDAELDAELEAQDEAIREANELEAHEISWNLEQMLQEELDES